MLDGKNSPLIMYLVTLENYRNHAESRPGESAKGRRFRLPALIIQLLVPIIAAIFLTWLGISFDETSNIISVVSIITGLMCAVATLLFDIRAGLMRDGTRYKKINKDEVGELYYLSVWIVVVGVCIVLLLMMPDFNWNGLIPGELKRMHFGICLALLVHFSLVLASFADRMISAYRHVAEGRI